MLIRLLPKLTDLPNLIAQFADFAALLECAVHKPDRPAFNFYLNHILTLTYSISILLPIFPAEHSVQLVRSLWLLTIIAISASCDLKSTLNSLRPWNC
jgi:hypothetical protein